MSRLTPRKRRPEDHLIVVFAVVGLAVLCYLLVAILHLVARSIGAAP